jgi:hypothetical protein
MNPDTLDLFFKILPWALLAITAFALYDWARDGWHKKVQKASHQFAKMGSKTITDLLDAIARSDRPAIAHIVESVIEHYGGEKGALLFGWEVFDMWIDDALDDKDYQDRVGRRLEEVILGSIISEEQQLKLGVVSTNFGKLGLKSASEFFQGLATGSMTHARNAIRDIVARFSDPDQVDDELVKLAPGIVADIKKNHPEHLPALRAALLSAEETAKIAV